MSERAAVMALDEWRTKAQAGEAPEDVILRKHFIPDLVKASKDTRQITFVISTGAVDREGDTIAVEGWDVENFLKNPVVLWAHRYDQLPVARALSVTRSAGQLRATAEFPEAGLYPLADTVYEMLKGGFLRATSVGFRPKKSVHNEERPGWAMDFLEQELLEFSVVPVPANPEALMETAKGLTGALVAGLDLAPLERAISLAKSVTDPPREEPAVAPPADKAIDQGVPPAPVEKSGRTFSAANEARIRDAHMACNKAVGHLKELLDQVTPEAPADDGAEEESAKAPEAPPPLTAPTPPAAPSYVLTTKDLTASMEAAVSAAVSARTRAAA